MRDILLVAVTLLASLTAPPLIAIAKARHKSRVISAHTRRQVVLTTKAGSTFEGVLFDIDRDALVLRNVAHLVQGADRPTPVDGELLVLTADVLFMQFP